MMREERRHQTGWSTGQARPPASTDQRHLPTPALYPAPSLIDWIEDIDWASRAQFINSDVWLVEVWCRDTVMLRVGIGMFNEGLRCQARMIH